MPAMLSAVLLDCVLQECGARAVLGAILQGLLHGGTQGYQQHVSHLQDFSKTFTFPKLRFQCQFM